MGHHKHSPQTARVLIACSKTYRGRRALLEALGSIFLDTIEGLREYYYFECPLLDEIFEDGVFSRSSFRQLVEGSLSQPNTQAGAFTHVVAGGDDAFVAKLLSDLQSQNALLVRLA